MNDEDRQRSRETSQQQLAQYMSAESRALAQRVSQGSASLEDLLSYAKSELLEAIDVMPPATPDNGRHADAYHAGCCVMRALFCGVVHAQAEINKLRDEVEMWKRRAAQHGCDVERGDHECA